MVWNRIFASLIKLTDMKVEIYLSGAVNPTLEAEKTILSPPHRTKLSVKSH